MYRFVPIVLIIILLPLPALSVEPPSSKAPTQTDLIIGLVDSLGWSFGLPDEPKIEDYVSILQGRRTWRFEIEDIYVPSAKAPLAPKEIRSFGSFSGKLWQRAPAREIEADLKFLLPIPGSYEIKAALTKPGYIFKINETELAADGERDFSEVSFGKADLPAGVHEAKVTIPPRGGIDYLLLLAPPVQAIEPIHGWKPDMGNRDAQTDPRTHEFLAVEDTRLYLILMAYVRAATDCVDQVLQGLAFGGGVKHQDMFRRQYVS